VEGVEVVEWELDVALERGLEGADEQTAKADEVPERLEQVWSMFMRNWMRDCLSNLSRTETVCTTSSKECGSALMMAITASSSCRLSRVKEEGESDLITLICS
jgi:hypothetical protein